jgi:hypothetical protein
MLSDRFCPQNRAFTHQKSLLTRKFPVNDLRLPATGSSHALAIPQTESHLRMASFLQPAPKRRLTLTRLTSRQQACHANIFIEVRPVDTHAAANKIPMNPLRRTPMRQTRGPCQRHGYGPAIGKIDAQRLLAHRHAPCNQAMPSLITPVSATLSATWGQVVNRPRMEIRCPRPSCAYNGEGFHRFSRVRRTTRGSGHWNPAPPSQTVGPHSSARDVFFRSSPVTTIAAILISEAPVQEWGPLPNERWRTGQRPRSICSGESNWAGSRFAPFNRRIARCPLAIVKPLIWTSSTAIR